MEPNINIATMKTFCDLVDTGSFSRAADSNYVSQSAVSQQVAKLERDLSVQLITRGGGIITPTDAGRAFYEGAREMLRRYEQLLGEVHSASDAVRGVLRVGTIYSVGFYLLDPFVRRFFREHPEVALHVTYTNWNSISAAVISGEMDLGVVACPDTNRSLEILPLRNEELVAVFPPKHDLTNRKTILAKDLAGESFVAFQANVPTRRHIDKLLKSRRVSVKVAMEFDNIELLKRAIMAGVGVSILPRENVEAEAARGDLSYVRFKDPAFWTRPIGVLRRRGRQASPAENMFVGILKEGT
ncbi:MAG: LysR family transcriptional regulator [Phycisphaerae bacterium]|nr:LysR family transcriptional regulator [Phycisphaerae bacterium]